MNCIFYNFAKRENSTAQPPVGNPGYTYDCKLKDEVSVINPHIILSKPPERTYAEMIGFNYVFIGDFFRYYFVRDAIFINATQIEYVLECDVLGSFKTQITGSTHYVLRSASSRDEYITDTAYITKMKMTGSATSGSVDGSTVITDPFAWSNGHSYILGIISKVGSTDKQIGSTVYYWLNSTELQAFINYLMNDVTAWSGINTADYDAAVQAALLNPAQYITSAIAVPFDKPTATGYQAINFGYYTYNIGGNIIIIDHSNMVKIQTISFTLPKHPQASSRGKYMNGAPFTRYSLHLSPFGDIPLDPASLIDESTLQVNVRTDLCTGIARIWVSGGSSSSIKIYTGSAQVGVPISLSQVLRDPLAQNVNMVNSVIDVASNVATLNVGGAIKAEINGLADATRLEYPSVIGGGTAGSFLAFHDDNGCYLDSKFMEAVAEYNTELGRPLCQAKTLSSLTGYCQCLNADVAITGTAEEASKVNNYLNNGFFIE